MTKTCNKARFKLKNNHSHICRQRCKRGNHPQIRAKVQKRALVKSHGKHLRRSKKVVDVEGTMALVKPTPEPECKDAEEGRI